MNENIGLLILNSALMGDKSNMTDRCVDGGGGGPNTNLGN